MNTSTEQNVSNTEAHPAFRFIRTEKIASLGTEVTEYQHRVTGAIHYHLAAQNTENVFLVALRTVPTDSTGVAHILEHTALCGSERFPVRDPFFMMIRRSLNTFMNAFTSSDWTAYPFASQNKKDFNNLLEVYLDAVFFSRLDPLDFAQEGHRIEFKDKNDPHSDLCYKGVVFNEMKGAMSSPVSTLWQTLSKHLFPSNTYHYNSGGEPEDIPSLSYDELLAFYKTHYHPSNAVFMTFGDIPAAEHQARFETLALSRFERLATKIQVENEKRYLAPLRVEEAYALDDSDMQRKTHIVLGWLLGQSINLEEQLEANLLSRVLLDNSASPLRHALETTDLGTAPSPMCGLEDSNREMSFLCGLEGCEPGDADAVEALIINVLKQVAEEGVPQDQVEAVLHQLELQQREISGDGYPFGLHLILGALSAALHGGDPIPLLNLDPVLEKLREAIQDPQYIPRLVQRYLLDNMHQVRLALRPDAELSSRRDAAEAQRLAQIKQTLSEAEKQALVTQAAALEKRQQHVDDESILPKVGLEDVPAEYAIPEGEVLELDAGERTFYAQGTNGLVYQQIIVALPQLSDEQQLLLPYYTQCVTELGCGERNYQQVQAWQSSVSGGINASISVRGAINNEQSVKGFFTLSSKALTRNLEPMNDLLHETFTKLRFDELPRIRELVAQQRARREQSVTGSGHSYAMMAATSHYSPCALLEHRKRGLSGIQFVKTLDQRLRDEDELKAFAQQLAGIHALIQQAPRRFLTVAEQGVKNQCDQSLNRLWLSMPTNAAFEPFSLGPIREGVRQAWSTSTQVNFCAKAFPTVTIEHEDAAALAVLGDFMRNGYLHRAIREQGGAYGGGAGQDASVAAFRFYSYRDPRLEETLADFDAAIDWMVETEHDPLRLEEAILGVVGSIDKPGSPAGEAKQAYHSALFGRTAEQRKAFRARILTVTLDDLKRVTEAYLKGKEGSVAVITSADNASKLAKSGFSLEKI